MDESSNPQAEPSEEELRAAYEDQLRRIHVEDVVIQTIVSLLNVAGRRAGLVPGTEGERDLEQVRLAVDSVRALLPLVEKALGPDADQLRTALSQLQMAYAQQAGEGAADAAVPAGEGPESGAAPAAEGAPQGDPDPSAGPGPAQSSGRLWVPGQ